MLRLRTSSTRPRPLPTPLPPLLRLPLNALPALPTTPPKKSQQLPLQTLSLKMLNLRRNLPLPSPTRPIMTRRRSSTRRSRPRKMLRQQRIKPGRSRRRPRTRQRLPRRWPKHSSRRIRRLRTHIEEASRRSKMPRESPRRLSRRESSRRRERPDRLSTLSGECPPEPPLRLVRPRLATQQKALQRQLQLLSLRTLPPLAVTQSLITSTRISST